MVTKNKVKKASQKYQIQRLKANKAWSWDSAYNLRLRLELHCQTCLHLDLIIDSKDAQLQMYIAITNDK